MAFRFIHTADWQLGAPFGGFEPDLAGELKAARRDVITSIANAARREDAAHVIVAGDVWDSETPSDTTLVQPLVLMGEATAITWWLMPGNHDVHGRNRLWLRIAEKAPGNVRILLLPQPVEAELGVWLLPAPWENKFPGRDLTSWMDGAITPEGALRIGVGHGSLEDFSSETAARVKIAETRTQTARLDYLALGDWHGCRQMGPRTWYSGTPEPDRHVDNERGFVLSVSIEAPGATPTVRKLAVARFDWPVIKAELRAREDVEALAQSILDGRTAHQTLAQLTLRGRLTMAERQRLKRVIGDLRARLAFLEVRDADLEVLIEADDLDALDQAGSVRAAAEDLLGRKNDPDLSFKERQNAARALDLLFTYAGSDEGAS